MHIGWSMGGEITPWPVRGYGTYVHFLEYFFYNGRGRVCVRVR